MDEVMSDIVYDEDYVFPITFTTENIKRTNMGFFIIDKNIRFRIYNYVTVKENIALSLTSKAMYMDMRVWFKLYLPSDHLSKEIVQLSSHSHNICHGCGTKNNRHVVFKTSSSKVASLKSLSQYDKLLYMCRSRTENDKIVTPKIKNKQYFPSLSQKYYTPQLPNNNSVYTYSFSLYPEQYQPSGTANFSRIDNYIPEFPVCWKCMYLLHHINSNTPVVFLTAMQGQLLLSPW